MSLKTTRLDLLEATKLDGLLSENARHQLKLVHQYHSATLDLKECIETAQLLFQIPVSNFAIFRALHDSSVIKYAAIFMRRGARSEITLTDTIFDNSELLSFHRMIMQYRHNVIAHYGDQDHIHKNHGIRFDDRVFLDIDETDEGMNDRIMTLYNRVVPTPTQDLPKLRAVFGTAHDYLDLRKRERIIGLMSELKRIGYDKLRNRPELAPKPPFDTLLI